MDYLRAKILWDHLEGLSLGSGEVSQEIADRAATALSLLSCNEGDEDNPPTSVGGLTSNDVFRYGKQSIKLTQVATEAIAQSLDATLNEVTLYYHAAEELDAEQLRLCKLRLDEDVKADLALRESELQELVLLLETVLSSYREAVNAHASLQTTLDDAMQRLPSVLNKKDAASYDLLALTIETSLLKLSVVRARMRASLYGYTSIANPSTTMAQAVDNLHKKLKAQEHALEDEERDLQSRLQDYQQLLDLVDGQGNGFVQVVEDLTRVRKETEECRKDLRRLGWTEN